MMVNILVVEDEKNMVTKLTINTYQNNILRVHKGDIQTHIYQIQI